MATKKTTASGTRKRAAATRRQVAPPFPRAALTELERRLPRAVSLKGWDKCPPAFVSPIPKVSDAYFDVDAVLKVVRALCDLRHTKGTYAGSPLIPDAWQIVWVVAPVFGWKNPDGTRTVREAYVEVPRKNGKSTIASGFGIVLLAADGELGAEVYSAATTRQQASIVFGDARSMVLKSPRLRQRIQPLASVLRVPTTGGVLRALSSIAEAQHGLNVSGGIIDELHVHKSRDLVDAITTGTAAREQPLIVYITTSDEGVEGSIYEEKHEYARKCAQRIVTDATYYAVIWAADPEADPFSESTWRSANPGLVAGKSPRLEYLRKEAAKARATPSYFPTFCRLHLNIRQRPFSRFISLGQWDHSAGMVKPESLANRECYGGLDLSATKDLTSLQLVFPNRAHTTLQVLSWFWMPAHGIEERIKRDQVPYDEWVRQGFITLTEGNVVDYDRIIEQLIWCRDHYDLRRIGHDRWQAGSVVQFLDTQGIEAVPVGQTFQGMSAATKELERLYLEDELIHGGNPVLRWNADCVEVQHDKSDNLRPVKPDRQKSSKRVDGITALVMAIDAWMRRPAAATGELATAPVAAASGDRELFRPSGRLNI